uniref:Cytochrome P450 n=1 Tax=Agasicles hygrophila TaxID=715812 RepID=A0A3S6FD59_9CUCU|nr:cytochrome P450 [Agasicles hygrophila]AZR39417.1 cytochrome P450 [Agasicles hygrophila]
MFIIVVLTFLFGIIYLLYLRYTYWSRNGVPGPKPLPFVGNFILNVMGENSIGEIVTDIYRHYDRYPFFGIYRGLTPILVVKDVNFIKKILIQDFKHFYDNDNLVKQTVDPVLGRNPFFCKGEDWKRRRAQLTGSFTTGKVKNMYIFMDTSSSRLVQYLENQTRKSNTVYVNDICARYTLENVAPCTFGLEAKCFEEKESNFRRIAEEFLAPGTISKPQQIIMDLFPWVKKYFKLKIVPEKVDQSLKELMESTLKYRKENNIVSHDFFECMAQIMEQDSSFTSLDMVGNAASFFFDGYETSTKVMSFLLLDLSLNQDIQDKLRKEVQDAYKKNNNKFTFDVIQDLPYLEACLNECLRLRPSLPNMQRTCTEDYTYTSTDPDMIPLKVTVKAGTPVFIPVQALQSDPKHFVNPDKFIPERFLDKEEYSFNKICYLPFGEGPRNCLGKKFGLVQLKVGIANIINNFKITFNTKTRYPLKYDPHYIIMVAVGGIWLDFHKLDDSTM